MEQEEPDPPNTPASRSIGDDPGMPQAADPPDDVDLDLDEASIGSSTGTSNDEAAKAER